MSRIIVKNLPKKVTEEKLRELFSSKGYLTDLQLKYTKDGIFRQFAFVGYKTEEEAQSAKEYFNDTYVNASKIKVEMCSSLGDENKPKSWSKHCQENITKNFEVKSSTDEVIIHEGKKSKKHKDLQNVSDQKEVVDDKHTVKLNNLPFPCKNKQIRRFLKPLTFVSLRMPSKHSKFAIVQFATEDEMTLAFNKNKEFMDGNQIDVTKYATERTSTATDNKQAHEDKKSKKHKKDLKNIPQELQNDDLFKEFLELNERAIAKPVWADDAIVKQDDESSSSNSDADANDDEDDIEKSPAKNAVLSDLEYLKSKMKAENNDVKPNDVNKAIKSEKKKVFDDKYTVKLKNLPFRCTRKQIKEFLKPLKFKSLRLPPRQSGFAFAQFATENEMNRALNKNRGFLDGHRIDVTKHEKKSNPIHTVNQQNPEENKEKNADVIAETGRLFVRNLCFDVKEVEVQTLFSKYGPITEVLIPIDAYTKQGLGFGFITYMFAEHAVKAYTELDGAIFQGRLLHIIPGQLKKEMQNHDELSFKKKKEAKIKSLSNSSHNWNTLFLGANAVADSMSAKYNISKSDLIANEDKESIAVRMALGETQIIMETREFLIQNGVQLDSFSQAAGERSKTTIIAKNLPAKTPSKQLLDAFSPHGVVSRVVVPPGGLTALVEFQQATEAKLAFKKLAYSKFGNLPLYLEWAPMNVFKEKAEDVKMMSQLTQKKSEGTTVKTEDVKTGEAETVDPEAGSTLFVKNLDFSTTEEALQNHFKGYGEIHSVCISKKKQLNSGKILSMGFGFVHFKEKSSAVSALQELQSSELDGRSLSIKFSNRATISKADVERKKSMMKEQDSAKILVRNIPFEVSAKEIRDLFKEFGQLKSVRLPKKLAGDGMHRGFGFVDFSSKENAKKAFDAMCHSTHLLGRRLVLEWANTNADDVTELQKKTARDFYTGGPQAKLKKSKLAEDVTLASIRSKDEF